MARATRPPKRGLPLPADWHAFCSHPPQPEVTDSIPEETWYWAAVGSIGISAWLKLQGKDNWSLFVGQWPPTFLLFGLYHRLIHPSAK